MPLAFKAITDTNDLNTSYFWSFGDGAKSEGKVVSHSYQYPGTYILVLNVKLFEYEAVSRATIKIVEPEVSINNATQDFVELKNKSQFEMNLYGFRLRDGTKIFEFPIDTIVGANSSVIFPKVVTKLDPISKADIKLETKNDPVNIDSTQPAQIQTAEVSKDGEISEARREEIQTLGDKLVSLNMELFSIRNPKAEATQEESTVEPQIQQTASAYQAVASTSWKTTLRRFFFR